MSDEPEGSRFKQRLMMVARITVGIVVALISIPMYILVKHKSDENKQNKYLMLIMLVMIVVGMLLGGTLGHRHGQNEIARRLKWQKVTMHFDGTHDNLDWFRFTDPRTGADVAVGYRYEPDKPLVRNRPIWVSHTDQKPVVLKATSPVADGYLTNPWSALFGALVGAFLGAFATRAAAWSLSIDPPA